MSKKGKDVGHLVLPPAEQSGTISTVDCSTIFGFVSVPRQVVGDKLEIFCAGQVPKKFTQGAKEPTLRLASAETSPWISDLEEHGNRLCRMSTSGLDAVFALEKLLEHRPQ